MKDKRPVVIDIAFTHSGWGEIGLAVGDNGVVIGPISYSTNAVADLARFALAACVGERRFACRFDGEPQESRWWAKVTGRRERAKARRSASSISRIPTPTRRTQKAKYDLMSHATARLSSMISKERSAG